MAKLFSKTIHNESRNSGKEPGKNIPVFLPSLFINQTPDGPNGVPDATNGVANAINQASEATNEASDGTNDAWDGANQTSDEANEASDAINGAWFMTNEAWDEANQAPVMAGKPQKVAKNATFTGFGGSNGQNETVLARMVGTDRRAVPAGAFPVLASGISAGPPGTGKRGSADGAARHPYHGATPETATGTGARSIRVPAVLAAVTDVFY
jgi:hypothetical protein